MKHLIILSFCVFALLFTGCKKEDCCPQLKPPVVDAGLSQAIQPHTNSTVLQAKIISSNGKIVGSVWSLVSGPAAATIVTAGNLTTQVNNLVAGKYVFQFMATDSVGLSGADTVSVTVGTAQQQTISLSATNNPTVLLALKASANWTDTGSTTLPAAMWTNGGDPFKLRGLFKFDLSAIPANATIVSAKLSLYSDPTPTNGNQVDANSGSDNSFYIQRCNSNWAMANIGWYTQPTVDASTRILMPHTNQTTLDLVDVDVTQLVGGMLGANNNGFMIQLQNEVAYNIRSFCSSKHPQVAKRPKLVITYQ